jgi:hypothetical protein
MIFKCGSPAIKYLYTVTNNKSPKHCEISIYRTTLFRAVLTLTAGTKHQLHLLIRGRSLSSDFARIMWKKPGPTTAAKAAPASAILSKADDDDDWETDPDYVNQMSEEQQRWGGARDTGTLK